MISADLKAKKKAMQKASAWLLNVAGLYLVFCDFFLGVIVVAVLFTDTEEKVENDSEDRGACNCGDLESEEVHGSAVNVVDAEADDHDAGDNGDVLG